jgi:hypothetical protein
VGQEARSTVRFNGQVSGGKAWLETDELVFRGDFRLVIPFRQISSIVAEGGRMAVRFAEGKAVFELDPPAPAAGTTDGDGDGGDARPGVAANQLAERWAERIRRPRTLVEKLGVRPGWKVAAIGIQDEDLVREIAEVTGRPCLRRAGRACDAVFLGVSSRGGLARIRGVLAAIKPDGALWVVRPKGANGVSEAAVRAASREAGLVDVKVVRLSDTHTAEKFVVPKGRRG